MRQKFLNRTVLTVSGLLCFLIIILAPGPAGAACEPLANDKGQAGSTIRIETSGDYALWVRMHAPKAESDSVFMQVGEQCPLLLGDNNAGDGLRWANFANGDMTKPVRLALVAGEYVVKVAGREAGAGVDKVMLVSDPQCAPAGNGDNCLAEGALAAENKPPATTEAGAGEQVKDDTPRWWVIGLSVAVGLGAIAFLVWRYVAFIRQLTAPGVILMDGILHAEATFRHRLQFFIGHHITTVILCAAVVLASLTAGIVAAVVNHPVFEPEAGSLTGGARLVDDAAASGGKYVLFENNPAAAAAGGSTTKPGGSTTAPSAGSSSGGSAGNTGSSSSGGGSTGGGSSSSGGGGSGSGGSGAKPSSCALPKYPTAACTGVPADWSPATTINGNLVITEAFISGKPNRTLENYLVTGTIDVRANNVTIRNTRVYGKIDNFVTNIIYGPLLIEDSEVVLPSGTSVSSNYESAIGVANYTCNRCKVTGRIEGWRVGASSYTGAGPVTIKHSYAKLQATQAQCDADDPHGDGIQGYGGPMVTIEHNTIDQRDDKCPTAPIFIPDQDNAGAVVKDNVLAGGGYGMRLLGGTFPTVTGNKIVNNTWGFGPIDVNCNLIGTWSGNALVTFDWNSGTILSQVAARNDC